MKIAIASGQGGTGKTTVATSLAFVASRAGRRVHLLDCDVEEPNCHIFLKPEIERGEPVFVSVPDVDMTRCDGCGECAAICQFKAITCLGKVVLTFPEMCHGCGACWLVCPKKAIRAGQREVGVLEEGAANGFRFTYGRLRVGQAMCPPLIREVKQGVNGDELAILDAPPGTACPMVTTVKNSDFVCLVTEPTPFGLHDLTLAVAVVRELGLPMGVVINRADIGDRRAAEYCQMEGIPVLAEIPDDWRVAQVYSRGHVAAQALPELRPVFESLLSEIERSVPR